VSLEGGAEPRLAGQLASVGHSVRLVYPILCCLSDYSLLYGRSVENFGLGDFWGWFMKKRLWKAMHQPSLAAMDIIVNLLLL
jgi:hypothetical protein